MTDDAPRPYPAPRSPLPVLFLIVVIDLIGFGIVLPLLPRYGQQYHVSPILLGFLMASFSAMQFLFAPFWGRLSDRVGRRPVLMVGLFGSILSYTLFGFADSFAVLLASRIAAGFFGATIGAAQAYIADVTTQEQRGRGMALVGAAFGLGFTIGPAIGGFAHSGLGHRAPGFIAAGLSAAALLLAFGALPEPPQRQDRAHRGLFDLTAVRHALATPTIPTILALQFGATFAFASFETTLSVLTKARWGYDERRNGYVFTFVGLVLVIAQGAIVRRLMPKVGERNFVALGTLLMAMGLGGLVFVPKTDPRGPLAAALAVAVTGFAMVTPSLSSLLSRRTPAAHQGEVLGLGQSMLSLARVLGPLWGNWLFGPVTAPGEPFGWMSSSSLSGWDLPYEAAAAVLAVAFVVALGLRRASEPDAAAAPPAR